MGRKLADLAELANYSVLSQGTANNFFALEASTSGTAGFTFEAILSKGFSDTSIYCLKNSIGSYAIRSWPDCDASHEKIDFWRSVNVAWRRNAPFGTHSRGPFPTIHSWSLALADPSIVIPFAEKLWTLSEWVNGHPIRRGDTQFDLIHHLASVLASIHKATLSATDESTGRLEHYRQQSPSIYDRLQFLSSLDSRILALVNHSDFFHESQLTDQVINSLSSLLNKLESWRQFLDQCTARNRECHWIVRDLWYENVLVDDSNHFSSIVDLGAARFDWPGLDFVRLFGSLIGVEDNLWETAYAVYTNEHPGHGIDSLDECRLLGRLSCGLSIAQWVRWITDARFNTNDIVVCQRLRSRITELCDQFLSVS